MHIRKQCFMRKNQGKKARNKAFTHKRTLFFVSMRILRAHHLAKIRTKMAYERFSCVKSKFHAHVSCVRGVVFYACLAFRQIHFTHKMEAHPCDTSSRTN